MKNFVGIDLGTTNSVICSYNGEKTQVYKSVEQEDVTPSAIFFDKRGNKYVGRKAYNMIPVDSDNVAIKFKRAMGTDIKQNIKNLGKSLTPEGCSAEIIKTLFNYLPDNIRDDPELGTVITVPAAFNQMQKEATLQTARMAGIGKVALMQEPVASIMAAMKANREDGYFLIYDLGGGTFDVAIAENIGGRVNLLEQGGIEMCGGSDLDRFINETIVRSWLFKNFTLPEEFWNKEEYKTFNRICIFKSEEAKKALSSVESTSIVLAEKENGIENNEEIYLDIPINRNDLDSVIRDLVNDTIQKTREIIAKAGLQASDFANIVFVGGPTCYKPLRDKVASELGIKTNAYVNPMTAVAEGASIYAETIDWSSVEYAKKNTKNSINSSADIGLKFDYIARTSNAKTKVAVILEKPLAQKLEFQIDSLDSSWSSGKQNLTNGAIVDLLLSKSGENIFKVFLFDEFGSNIPLEENKIIVAKTIATVGSIPASHSISVEVLDRFGGNAVIDYLVKAGDILPKKGKKMFRAGSKLGAGENSSLNFKLWEGDIEKPVTDNRFIGVMKISGNDFEDGVIQVGTDIECEYEMKEDGNIILNISIPSIRSQFNSDGKNFYSRQEGQKSYNSMDKIIDDAENLQTRIDEIGEKVDDDGIIKIKEKVKNVLSVPKNETDPEKIKMAEEKVLEVKNSLFNLGKKHNKEIYQIELDKSKRVFSSLRKYADPNDIEAFDTMVTNAQRAIDRNSEDFEEIINEIKGIVFKVMWAQDWFIVERFKNIMNAPPSNCDERNFERLTQDGLNALQNNNIDKLRRIVFELSSLFYGNNNSSYIDMNDITNIIKG